MSQDLPLAGYRVVDYSHFIAGPFLSRCLAAMGAEVIKVERPTAGDPGRQHPYFLGGQSGYYLQQNMGKQGLCVNLKDPRGLDLMHRLVNSADVFVENYRPGTMARLGLGYPELSARNPRLVYCSISANGHTGPDAAQAGYGLIAEAKSGAMAMLGEPGAPPPLFRIALADMYTGIHGVAAVCAALLGRAKSGRGQHIDLALYDTMVSMHEYAVQCYTLSGGREIPEQTGRDLRHSTLCGVFCAQDGDGASVRHDAVRPRPAPRPAQPRDRAQAGLPGGRGRRDGRRRRARCVGGGVPARAGRRQMPPNP